MAWVRLDDLMPENPKVLRAGPGAGWLHVCALAYCNRNLTDGHVPATALRRLADLEDPAREAERLVEAGLWDEVEDGYEIHDYLDFQPSAAEVRKQRETKKKAGKAGARARWGSGTDGKPVAGAMAGAKGSGNATALPPSRTRPVPTEEKDSLLAVLNEVADAKDVKRPKPETIAQIVSEFPGVNHQQKALDLRFYLLEGNGASRRKVNVASTFRNFCKPNERDNVTPIRRSYERDPRRFEGAF